MSRTVNREHIDQWVKENYPNAVAKLAIEAGLSANTLAKIRIGYVPQDAKKRRSLAKVLGVSEDVLFPPQGNEAS